MTIIENVDVTEVNVGDILKNSALVGVPIDVLIHHAGGYNGSSDDRKGDASDKQSVKNVTPDLMMKTFQLNTLGPLRVQQALHEQIKSPGGKVLVISTGMGSIGDNGSGRHYAYRCSKAAVNMLAKGWSCDFKEQGIAVQCVAPGMVVTEFLDPELMKSYGAMPVETSVAGLVKVIDNMNMDNTGKYMCVYRDKPPQEYPAGW